MNAIWPGARSRFLEAGADWLGRDELRMPGAEGARRRRPPMDPADVAPIAVYLARGEAKDINAQILRASAGDISRVTLIGAQQSVSKEDRSTQAELSAIVPLALAAGIENSAPASDRPVRRWMV